MRFVAVNHGIEFFKPEDEFVPTSLRLKVDGKVVYYKQDKGFSYIFTFYGKEWTLEDAEQAVKRIVAVMESQSKDWYSRWEMASMEQCAPTSFLVKFMVRDSG